MCPWRPDPPFTPCTNFFILPCSSIRTYKTPYSLIFLAKFLTRFDLSGNIFSVDPRKKLSQYKKVGTESSTPLQQVIQVYEIAISSAHRVQKAIEDKDLNVKDKEINRFLSCIEELNCALAPEVAPEMASNLERLYDFFTFQALQANMRNNPDVLEPVIKILVDLKKTWIQVSEKLQKP